MDAKRGSRSLVAARKMGGSCRGKPGCWGFSSDYHQLNLSTHSSRTGALGVIGLSGRARQRIKGENRREGNEAEHMGF